MSLLKNAVDATKGIEGLHGLAESVQNLIDADTGTEAAAASEIFAELALLQQVTLNQSALSYTNSPAIRRSQPNDSHIICTHKRLN